MVMKYIKSLFLVLQLLYVPVYSAQLTINVPIEAQYFKPDHSLVVTCDLFRNNNESSDMSQQKNIQTDSSGEYMEVAKFEFGDVENLFEITHYICSLSYKLLTSQNNFDIAGDSSPILRENYTDFNVDTGRLPVFNVN
jgi:hypothetical protein